jgi:hypothetical protein
MSQQDVRTQEPNDSLGAPLLTIYNTTRHWWAPKNYDLVLYQHAILIVLGLGMHNLGREKQRRREVRKEGSYGLMGHVPAGNAERSATIAATPVPEVLAADGGNRLIALKDIESAVLSRRLGVCKLKVRLIYETRLKYGWFNWSSRYANYDDVVHTLTRLLPERFRAS